MTRRTRTSSVDRGPSMVGERFTVEVGPVAHGGHMVARVPEHDNRVVFVRHTAPGERIVVAITEGRRDDRFWRGDAVEVLQPSPDRVAAPCPAAGPGLCGGCDFQHLSLTAQRELKRSVVAEQLQRLAQITWSGVVAPVPGDEAGLRWRTRVTWSRTPDGRRGLKAHRSHDVISVEDCLIAAPETDADPAPLVVHRVEAAGQAHEFQVAGDGFWQVHPGAPTVLTEAVLTGLQPQPGDTVLDLYAGVGLFSAFLAEAVGEDGRVIAVEGDLAASRHSTRNLEPWPWATSVHGDVAETLDSAPYAADLVVLDPPREGARKKVVDLIATTDCRTIAYVACDPASLARDVGLLREHGYELTDLRAFDLFPMTHHVECVAILTHRGAVPQIH